MNDQPTNKPCSCCGSSEKLDSGNWQSRYVAGETGWDRGEPSPALLHWLENGDLTPCRILVPGCGRGHEVVELASRAFEVTAVDFADAPVQELARSLAENNLVAEVLQEDILNFASSERFDAIYEQTCLCAIDPGHRTAYEERLANHVKFGGKLFALFMQSGKGKDGPPFPCYIDEMKRLFDESRWLWPEKQLPVDHPAGLQEIAVVLQRRDPNCKR